MSNPPILTGSQAVLAHGIADVAYTVTAAQLLSGVTDADGNTLTAFNLVSANMATLLSGSDYIFVPQHGFTGTVNFTYSVMDGTGNAIALSQSITFDAPTSPVPYLALSNSALAENSPVGTIIGTVAAIGMANTGLTWSLPDDNGGVFQINATTGVVSVAEGASLENGGLDGNRLDFESFPHQTIIAKATANNGAVYYEAFTIDLTNVPETHKITLSPKADTFTAPNAEIWQINAGMGNDVITTLGGNDIIYGGGGNDILSSGGGDDVFHVAINNGFDSIDGGTGFDTVIADLDNTVIGLASLTGIEAISAGGHTGVTIKGTSNGDTLDFSGTTLTGIALIQGATGADIITGSASDDTIEGGYGDDVLNGGLGDDIFLIGTAAGKDSIDGGGGFDTIKVTADNLKLSFTYLTSVEAISADGHSGTKIVGTAGADTLDFGATTLTGIVAIEGGAGNDTIVGSAGADTIVGGTGIDTLKGGQGNDTFLVGVGVGADIYDGGSGTDTIKATADNVHIAYTSLTGIEAISADGHTGVTITGGTTSETLDLTGITLTGISAIDGGMGDDLIKGSAGNDVIIGGSGTDTLTGNGGSDTFVFKAVSASLNGVKADHITDFATGDLIDLSGIDADATTAGVQHFTFIGSANFTGLGQLRLGIDGGHAALFGNTVGSLKADFEIVLDNNATIHLADLVL